MREREGEKAGEETAGVKKRTTKIYSMCGCLSTAVTVVYKHSCNTSCNTIMCVHRGNGSRVYACLVTCCTRIKFTTAVFFCTLTQQSPLIYSIQRHRDVLIIHQYNLCYTITTFLIHLSKQHLSQTAVLNNKVKIALRFVKNTNICIFPYFHNFCFFLAYGIIQCSV